MVEEVGSDDGDEESEGLEIHKKEMKRRKNVIEKGHHGSDKGE